MGTCAVGRSCLNHLKFHILCVQKENSTATQEDARRGHQHSILKISSCLVTITGVKNSQKL